VICTIATLPFARRAVAGKRDHSVVGDQNTNRRNASDEVENAHAPAPGKIPAGWPISIPQIMPRSKKTTTRAHHP